MVAYKKSHLADNRSCCALTESELILEAVTKDYEISIDFITEVINFK